VELTVRDNPKLAIPAIVAAGFAPSIADALIVTAGVIATRQKSG
jgi:hypothetical protein